MKKEYNGIARNVEIRLLMANKTQRELADYLGFDDTYISKMLRGAKKIPAETVFQIADFLKVSVYDLVTPVIDYNVLQTREG